MRVKDFVKQKGISRVSPEMQRFEQYGAIYNEEHQAQLDSGIRSVMQQTLPTDVDGEGGGEAPGVSGTFDASGRVIKSNKQKNKRDAFGNPNSRPSDSVTQLRTGSLNKQSKTPVKITPN